MLIVQTAVQTYVDDFAVTTDSGSDDFPIADRLSGDYYIACESYWVQDEPWFPRVGRERTYCFSVMARCLEHPQAPHQTDLDYLGLEVHFLWNVASSEFMFTGDVDSSSI
ncbi:MAG: hypothetical protein FWC42_09085 [Proteobacteria bacterium]|nr:hypothetical protein [Pseudomonadota bacterium]MCL2310405.1 hypothetical protein [Pseudomonadota bacterium]